MERIVPFIAASVAVVSALTFAVGSAQVGPAPVNCTTATAALDAEESYMLVLINGARAAAGVPTLDAAGTLNRAAAWKAEDQAGGGTLGEIDRLGRDLAARTHDCGYAPPAVVTAVQGEVWASGVISAQPIFDFWMASTLVRQTLLRPDFTVAGIGHSGSSWVATFGSWDDGSVLTPPPPNLPYRVVVPMLAR